MRVLCNLNTDRLEGRNRVFTGMSLRLFDSGEDTSVSAPIVGHSEIAEKQQAAAIDMTTQCAFDVDLSAAHAGIMGGAGQLPEGWLLLDFSRRAERKAEIVAATADYLDVEITQTASTGASILQFTDAGNWMDTHVGDSWTFSAELALISGSFNENGAASMSGTDRDELGRIHLTDDISIDDTLRAFFGKTIISDPEAAQMNAGFRVQSSGSSQAKFRIGRTVLEKNP